MGAGNVSLTLTNFRLWSLCFSLLCCLSRLALVLSCPLSVSVCCITATHCYNTLLQHIVTTHYYCSAFLSKAGPAWIARSAVYCVVVCCSMLQCDAVCCSVLQSVAVYRSVLQFVAVFCSVSQCVTYCCGALQCVAVCCSVLQCADLACVAIINCNTVLHTATHFFFHCNTILLTATYFSSTWGSVLLILIFSRAFSLSLFLSLSLSLSVSVSSSLSLPLSPLHYLSCAFALVCPSISVSLYLCLSISLSLCLSFTHSLFSLSLYLSLPKVLATAYAGVATICTGPHSQKKKIFWDETFFFFHILKKSHLKSLKHTRKYHFFLQTAQVRTLEKNLSSKALYTKSKILLSFTICTGHNPHNSQKNHPSETRNIKNLKVSLHSRSAQVAIFNYISVTLWI